MGNTTPIPRTLHISTPCNPSPLPADCNPMSDAPPVGSGQQSLAPTLSPAGDPRESDVDHRCMVDRLRNLGAEGVTAIPVEDPPIEVEPLPVDDKWYLVDDPALIKPLHFLDASSPESATSSFPRHGGPWPLVPVVVEGTGKGVTAIYTDEQPSKLDPALYPTVADVTIGGVPLHGFKEIRWEPMPDPRPVRLDGYRASGTIEIGIHEWDRFVGNLALGERAREGDLVVHGGDGMLRRAARFHLPAGTAISDWNMVADRLGMPAAIDFYATRTADGRPRGDLGAIERRRAKATRERARRLRRYRQAHRRRA